MWYYQNQPFEQTPDDCQGFVYIIENLTNGRKYIGKKNFWATRRIKQKGKTRRKVVRKESDWKKYYGSNTHLCKDVEELGEENFKRTILHLCKGKGDMSYMELKEQMDHNVLLSDEFYNGIIQVRINASHLTEDVK